MKISKSSVIDKLSGKLNDAEKELSRLTVVGVEDKDLETWESDSTNISSYE